jgi:glycosyltransferase involved in cell wall biosynthesis
MSSPKISVLMPVWNGATGQKEEWLCIAIRSILDQTFEDFEFVIVNDGSTDDTHKVLKKYADEDDRIRIFDMPKNQGIVAALNHGLRQCRGKYIARQDSDDISTVTRLEIEKKFLDDRPETAMCGTGMYVINEEGKLIMEINDRPCNPEVIRESLKTCCVFVHGSVMFRREVMEKLGGYSGEARFQHAEDFEMWVRMAKDHRLENIPGKTLYFHRNHGSKIGEVHRVQQETASRLIMDIARQTL